MSSKLVYNLVKIENGLVFQVKEQDERFFNKIVIEDGNQDDMLQYKAPNGWTVGSRNVVAIDPVLKTLYLSGSFSAVVADITAKQKVESQTTVIFVETNKDRDKMFNDIHKAIKSWAENAPVFKEEKDVKVLSEHTFSV